MVGGAYFMCHIHTLINHQLMVDWSTTFEVYEVLRPNLPTYSGLYKVIVDLDDGYFKG